MDFLRTFYVRSMATAAVSIALCAIAISLFFERRSNGQNAGIDWVNISSRTVLIALLWIVDHVVRKYLWKRAYPKYDFTGKWRGRTTYNDNNPSVEQEVEFEQDCLSLRLKPCSGENFVFLSRAIEIHDQGDTLVYAYHVKYTPGTPNRPDEAYGYEELTVKARERSSGRPTRVEGWFAHCDRQQRPIFSGTVKMERTDSIFSNLNRAN